MTNAALYSDIAEHIVQLLQEWTKPWECPWAKDGSPGFPMNGARRKRCQGINVLHLWAVFGYHQYSSQLWLTYKQSQGFGGQVRA